MRIIPIASGKGGVGKSLVVANLGIAFAQAGSRVILVDMDLGASNLHLILGHHSPKTGIGTFLNNTKSDFSGIIADTDVRGLRFIPGDNEIPGTANLTSFQRKALVKRLLTLKDEADIMIIDLGAGTHQSILDFFLISNQGIVVSAPAVTAVLNAYIFLKNTVFRLMFNSCTKDSPAHAYLEKVRKEGAGGHHKLYIPKMLPEIKRLDPESYEIFNTRLEALRPKLIMNMVDEPKNADVAMKIRHSCEEYLDLKIEHMGIIYRDVVQDTALASRLPILLYKPQSLLSQAIYRIADKILQSPEDDYSPDDKQIENSFQEAEMEAEIDFDSKLGHVEDLLHSGAMSHSDLIETVKSQQLEISKLKKENNFIKLKLSHALQQGFKV
jgi:flagellar biosynthesis protein FlhG